MSGARGSIPHNAKSPPGLPPQNGGSPGGDSIACVHFVPRATAAATLTPLQAAARPSQQIPYGTYANNSGRLRPRRVRGRSRRAPLPITTGRLELPCPVEWCVCVSHGPESRQVKHGFRGTWAGSSGRYGSAAHLRIGCRCPRGCAAEIGDVGVDLPAGADARGYDTSEQTKASQ